jgi:predicted ABC-type exoprotein transport system permease subunit
MIAFPLLAAVNPGFVSDFAYIFAIAIASLILTITLRSVTLFLAQTALLTAIITLNSSGIVTLFITITVLQLLLTIYLLYKLKLAVDWNYGIVEEKTHLKEPNITKDGYNGTRRSFS